MKCGAGKALKDVREGDAADVDKSRNQKINFINLFLLINFSNIFINKFSNDPGRRQ